jgi:hypothetical protein
MPTKARGPKFSGALNEPIVGTHPLALAVLIRKQPESVRKMVWKAQKDRITKQQVDKLRLLLKHYKIAPNDPNRFLLLAFHLARDFVPGMSVVDKSRRGRGAPRKWKGLGGKLLVREIQSVNAERKKGIADAIRIVRRRHPEWCDGYTNKTLEARYYEALAQSDEPEPDEFFQLVKNALQSGTTKIPS